ncbi:MAG TPA: hypothetical protein PKY50_16550 [Candidatus Competibacter sp.]|nr:hypothetical protein [Candidatus Competibacter sp.]
MPYSNFSFDQIKLLGIKIEHNIDIFSSADSVDVPESFYREMLEDIVPLALSNNTEKARSELIISPVLLQLRKIENKKISLFSGVDFNVDEEKGLKGACDFIISLSDEQLFLDAPVIALVEAKKENIIQGVPQCIAEMKAAQIFNERRKNRVETIFGVVTTGIQWQFLKLVDDRVSLDLDQYYIKELGKILGILHFMCNSQSRLDRT